MILENIIARLSDIVGSDYVKVNESMAGHCTFRCGGNAAVYVIPGSIDEVVEVVKACREEEQKFMIIGNGSNLLVRDEGYDGVIVEIGARVSTIDIIGEDIVVDAGAKLSVTATAAMENDLAGMEFAHGIPGNVGGAVAMNAGAYGGEMAQIIKTVKVLDENNEVKDLSLEELDLGYRCSRIQKENLIVLQARLGLMLGSAGEIAMVMQMLMSKRKAKQPLEYPSAGSTFKRPEGHFAGKLIEDAGLRGYTVGGAQVSEKHCGFVINYDNATATDIIQLMQDVKQKVKEQFDVELEPEVKII
ncbi:MAG: UDP-N-acetylmuramate dehydrogenase [Eubacterium sp.]|nr:UDP-N-acetylmuramate dehydrogenase [Eubacterium sp.]